MQFHLFGAATPTGAAFCRHLAIADPSSFLHAYSRNPISLITGSSTANYADFHHPHNFFPAGAPGNPSIWISFGPLWLFAPFLESLATNHPEKLQGLCGVIACSSSSSITKRFAANRFDRQLVSSLTAAEDLLFSTCQSLLVSCHILQPTLIYGQVGGLGDCNLSLLLKQLRRLPILPIPSECGLRQPIHSNQLAAVALKLAQQISGPGLHPSLPDRIALGGDTTLDYAEMIFAIQRSQPLNDPAHRCRLLPIPNRLFFFLSAPLLFFSPKAFEAVLRIASNLSGFTPAHHLLGSEPQPFPVHPLA